jgi:hypothetical protein
VSRKQLWAVAYYVLFMAFLATAALNMLHVRAGFFTNHAADVVVPAWLYVECRGLYSRRGRERLVQRMFGRTPEMAALSLFTASTLTEISQRFWPHGLFSGRFDPLDILAYAGGLAACYVADKLSARAVGPGAVVDGRPVG